MLVRKMEAGDMAELVRYEKANSDWFPELSEFCNTKTLELVWLIVFPTVFCSV